MGSQSVTLDVQEALLRLNGNRQILARLLSRFMELNRNVEDAARKALDSGNRDDIVLFLHSLKGGAANLSAKRFAEQTAHMEALAKAGGIEAVKEELPAFLDRFRELEAAVEDYCKS